VQPVTSGSGKESKRRRVAGDQIGRLNTSPTFVFQQASSGTDGRRRNRFTGSCPSSEQDGWVSNCLEYS
jgi:hypothetical protein